MEQDESSWVHVGYRKSLPTIPINRDKTSWYTEHGKHIELSKISRGGHVLLIGDDLIERLAYHPKVWSKYFGQLHTLNYGLCGDRTQHVLWRIENGILPVNAETIFIYVGENNVIYDRAHDIANGVCCIALMCRKNKPNAKIILAGLLPFIASGRKKIRKVNKYLKLFCLSGHIENCYYVKPDEDWLFPDDSLNMLYYYNGLSESGVDKFAKTISDTITSLNIGVKIEMSSDSDISEEDDNFLDSISQNNPIKTECIDFPVLDSTDKSYKYFPTKLSSQPGEECKSFIDSSNEITSSCRKARTHRMERNSFSDKRKHKDSSGHEHSRNSR